MSEKYCNYIVNPDLPITRDAFKRLPCSLPLAHPEFVEPTSREVKSLRLLLGFSQADLGVFAGKRVTKKGCSHVRKWETDESKAEHRDIELNVWRRMLYAAGVCTVCDDIDFIKYNK
ncbi:hypothetical protein QJ364_004053 [Vibrio vulnificus]|nr:hypothetical protein [Vibrio vulnificus]EKE1120670.1 hypothetical protein [Vibrio vulnificus]ELQ2457257.1 hypothetical protein [Vibrio vulnificus]ELX4171209.1 hypothetical protein [Vibrio vulnificus]EME0140368.1 hypothetical protein [Vibrio vulnificus]